MPPNDPTADPAAAGTPERRPALALAGPVTLVGGGPLDPTALALALARAPVAIAADGAAEGLARLGVLPRAVVGDMDSLPEPGRWRAAGVPVIHLPEQDTTDFEKCLYAVEAPLYLATGFTGGRVDHLLAVLHAMLARPERRVVLAGGDDCIALLAPGRVLRVAVGVGARVSLFALQPSRGVHSRGLEWPVEGLEMAPGVQSGTSNRASAPVIEVAFDRPGVLVLLEPTALGALVEAMDGDGTGGDGTGTGAAGGD